MMEAVKEGIQGLVKEIEDFQDDRIMAGRRANPREQFRLDLDHLTNAERRALQQTFIAARRAGVKPEAFLRMGNSPDAQALTRLLDRHDAWEQLRDLEARAAELEDPDWAVVGKVIDTLNPVAGVLNNQAVHREIGNTVSAFDDAFGAVTALPGLIAGPAISAALNVTGARGATYRDQLGEERYVYGRNPVENLLRADV
ncbi:MAG: hypothetical protein KF812_10235 [Fimbriimonadaceae bacterium]|nr:hypothetical protein [Fimbriimonadaceae bacterium]